MYIRQIIIFVILFFFQEGLFTAKTAELSNEYQPALKHLSLKRSLPTVLKIENSSSGAILDLDGRIHHLTIDWPLQRGLELFLAKNKNPIAAIAVAEVHTGRILALVQGRDPSRWGSQTHTALYPHFPAASLFKLVTTAAAIEVLNLGPFFEMNLVGGCQNVHPRGIWMRDAKTQPRHRMNFARAFASSCNGFYAKLSLQHLGVSLLNHYALQFGWGKDLTTDFDLVRSPIQPPLIDNSTVQSVGNYAAGFGDVQLSVMHALWMNVAVANYGVSQPLTLFAKPDPLHLDRDERTEQVSLPTKDLQNSQFTKKDQIIDELTALRMMEMMKYTVTSGTASSAFKRGYRHLRSQVGGKTGTLKSTFPKGLATWFAGVMPIDQPEIAVAAIVINESSWIIKGTHLAAEALFLYQQEKVKKNRKLIAVN